jgi:hypothetical protein
LAEHDKKPIHWADILTRVAIPGLLIAFTGIVGEWALSTFSSTQENARLVTNLQIQREIAESILRKDIFNQALGALLVQEKDFSHISELRKRLLKLELLSLNFGDSLSLSPFFSEFERDFKLARAADGGDLNDNEQIRIGIMRKRLRSLAKRVASAQTSSLLQHGVVVVIKVPLTQNGKALAIGKKAYKWPEAEMLKYSPDIGPKDLAFVELLKAYSMIKLEDHTRHMLVTVSNLEPVEKKVSLAFEICLPKEVLKSGKCNLQHRDSVHRDFTLDLFNFPKIDNTRLSENQRMAFVLENFPDGRDSVSPGPESGEIDADGSAVPTLEINAIFFPSEYASLRERPSMQEALDLLHRAQNPSSDKGVP